MSAARNAALQALRKVGQDSGYSNIVLDQEIRRRGLSGPDAALATTLFYGVLEKQITLDYVLSDFSRQPLSRLDPEVLDILRLGAFQILYLDRIPDFSAVNEAVNAVKKNRRTARASGFVNAVLRSLLRSRDTLRYPDPEKDPLLSLSVRTCAPRS